MKTAFFRALRRNHGILLKDLMMIIHFRSCPVPVAVLFLLFSMGRSEGGAAAGLYEKHGNPTPEIFGKYGGKIKSVYATPQKYQFKGNRKRGKSGVVYFSELALSHFKKNLERPKVRNWYEKQMKYAQKAMNASPNPVKGFRIALEVKTTDEERQASLVAARDFETIVRCGLAFRVSGRKTALKSAQQYLVAWAKTFQPTGHPINDEPLSLYVIGYELVRDHLDPASREIVDSLLERQFNAGLTWMQRHPGPRHISNQSMRHLVSTSAIAYLIGGERQKEYVKNVYELVLHLNLRPDGTTYDYWRRDAVSYHDAVLKAMLGVSLIAENNGMSWYARLGPQGQCIRRSLDFLVPLANEINSHIDFAHSNNKNDHKRKKKYDPNRARRVLAFASRMDSRYVKYFNVKLFKFPHLIAYLTAEPSLFARALEN